ncbi:MAG: CDP-diacylglycerol--glycerol-3-phosphate 3-phosphatidyltransferase [Parvularculaceae bacterium]
MANFLTLMRIVLILPFAACFFLQGDTARWLAFALFMLAGLTDFFDGYVARKFNQTSALGAALDPIADKLLTGAALLLLAYAGLTPGWHMAASVAILMREILISGLREAVAGQAGVAFPVTQLAKWKTTFQFIALAILIAPVTGLLHNVGLGLFWLAAILTVWTGFGYVTTALRALK